MNLLKDSITCSKCKLILKLPVTLPCGHCICKHHVNEVLETNAANKQIECFICTKLYDIPVYGFAPNRPLESLFEKNIELMDLGKEYNSARYKCEQFEELLNRFKRLKNDPETGINSVISELKNKVDLRREELKQEIDNESMKIIEKLDEFEKECKSNLASLKSDSKLDERLVRWENDLKQWFQQLSTFQRNVVRWETIFFKSKLMLKPLYSEFLKFNRRLFLNRLDEIKPSQLFIESSFDSISLDVIGLSHYQDNVDLKCIASHSVKAIGIDWCLMVYIQSVRTGIFTKKSENYIGIYLTANHLYKDGNINVDLVVVDQFGMDESIVKNISIKLNSKLYDCPNVIRLKDLMKNFNLYNVERDSCKVQAIIKKIEWF